MYAPSFILIALCASTSILAAPFRIPGFGSKMTSALARDAHHVADAVRIGQGSRQTVPNGVGYAILHKAANAKLPKGATPTMEYAKFRAQALIQRLRAEAEFELKATDGTPAAVASAERDLKMWNDAVDNGQWKKVVGAAAVAGGVGGWVGAHAVHNHNQTEAHDAAEASAQPTAATSAPVTSSNNPATRPLSIEHLD